jgi:hypothetical protein
VLECPKCRVAIPASDVNIEALVGKCVACNHLFRIDPSALASEASAPAQSPGRPSSITLVRDEPSDVFQQAYRDSSARPPVTFTLRRRWFQAQHVFLFFFCIAWDSFLVFWYGSAFGTDAPWLMIVFPLAHVAVGVGLTYWVLCGFVNRTTLALTPETLSVRHGPLPWRGNGTYGRRDIRGVELTRHVNPNSKASNPQTSNVVSLQLADRSLAKLVSGLTDEEARFIEWTLSDALRS